MSSTPLSVLLAEDNPINQKLALALLKRRDAQVTLAQNGLEAVEAWSEADFDIVLMDIQMPVMDGLEATRLIRSREEGNEHVPIIAVTARAMKGDREECLAAGMDAYVSKPVRSTELMETIERLTSPAEDVDPAPVVEEAAPAQVFDLAGLRANVADDESLVQELVSLFLADASGYVRTLAEASAAKDATALLEGAHALKGAAGAVMASRIAVVASMIERQARGGVFTPAEEIALLKTELAEFERVVSANGLLAAATV